MSSWDFPPLGLGPEDLSWNTLLCVLIDSFDGHIALSSLYKRFVVRHLSWSLIDFFQRLYPPIADSLNFIHYSPVCWCLKFEWISNLAVSLLMSFRLLLNFFWVELSQISLVFIPFWARWAIAFVMIRTKAPWLIYFLIVFLEKYLWNRRKFMCIFHKRILLECNSPLLTLFNTLWLWLKLFKYGWSLPQP